MGLKAYMTLALDLAEEAMRAGEVPVGAVIVKDGVVIATGQNQVERTQDPIAHAEVVAIQKASKVLGNWRLSGCTLYVTLEPCIMCMGAILNGRISKLVYGAGDNRKGAVESQVDLIHSPLYQNIEIYPGILEEECSGLMKAFFKGRRKF